MLLTPTYHVFEMCKVHQGATLLPQHLTTDSYTNGTESIPAVSASVSQSTDGAIHLTLCHTDPRQAATLTCDVRGIENVAGYTVSGRVLTAPELNAKNGFGENEGAAVAPQEMSADALKMDGANGKLIVQLPPACVVAITLTK